MDIENGLRLYKIELEHLIHYFKYVIFDAYKSVASTHIYHKNQYIIHVNPFIFLLTNTFRLQFNSNVSFDINQ